MNATGDPRIDRIAASPVYKELKHKRNTLGWTLTILMLIAYFGYIGLIAFDKAFLAQPIGDGVSSIGIPIAIGLMVFTIALTGFYVRRANNEFDRLAAQVLEENP
ncbi:MAG: DUF485 domain-containing protein [Proteobacteria bacterium]|nr:DUF485 domain-containing protein [Pseudomonadota bacterium]MBS0217848.1 DUF485 domain-containing protein [Pseudomonadota bacterium]